MAAATANGSDDDYSTKTQQPMLASQRAKQNAAAQKEARTGPRGGYFPLGYKEGFSQWVCPLESPNVLRVAESLLSGQTYRPLSPSTKSCPSFHTFGSRLRKPKPAPSRPLRSQQSRQNPQQMLLRERL